MEVRMTNGFAPNGLLFGGWNQLLNDLDRGAERGFSPRADVVEDADGYHFHFEMPGLKAESADVRIEDGTLIVEAERKSPEWSKEATVRVSERAYGKCTGRSSCRTMRRTKESAPHTRTVSFRLPFPNVRRANRSR